MGEVANVIVAFAVIVFLFKWVTSSSSGTPDRTAADTLGFRPKNATQDMVDTVSAMFPDIPPDNIRYDLLRTGNVELTTNKILEKGFLEAPPPAYYTLYPRTQNPAPVRPVAARNTAASPSKQPQESLISRYSLQDRVAHQKPDDPLVSEQEIGGKAVWEETPEKREASLRERKAQMILAARQRLLAQKQQKQGANASASGISTS